MTDELFPGQDLIVRDPIPGHHTIRWSSPSNIALIKYWGKMAHQVPSSPSISMTLQRSVSEIGIRYQVSGTRMGMVVEYEFEGGRNMKFEQRIRDYLHALVPMLPFLDQLEMKIDSRNTFPHSAGIASSASGFSALALCLCSIEQTLFSTLADPDIFYRKASYLARLGSGSAARSVYGGFTTWGKTADPGESADMYAQPLRSAIHPDFRDLQDAVLIVSSQEKSISSSQGHALMNDHPYGPARFAQARENYAALVRCMATGDMPGFIDITEQEALSLHALMMSSRKGYMLLHPHTVLVLERIRKYRDKTGHPVCFTMDAGPNVHLIYPGRLQEAVHRFISEELLPLCENGRWIDDRIGNGPVRIE